MCGQCQFDRKTSGRKPTPAPATFVRPGPLPAPASLLLLPASAEPISPTVAKIRRIEKRQARWGWLFWMSIASVIVVAAWKYRPALDRMAADPKLGLLQAIQPDPDQIIITEYLNRTLDDSYFEFVSADRVDGDVVRRAWQAEMSDVVRRWELFVKNNPKAEFMGVQADLLDGDMQKIRHAVNEMRKFDNQRFFRLRFRAKNRFGAKEIRDVVFTLEGAEVISSVPMNEPFPVWASFMPMLDPRIWFIQVEIGKGKADSRDHAFDAIFSQPERRWESRP